MPYVSCPACARRTYAPRAYAGRTLCPSCDAPLEVGPALAAAPTAATRHGSTGGARGDRIGHSLDLARAELGMDVALLTEVADGREVARRTVGSWGYVDSLEGFSLPLEETLCARMLDGRISNIVADTSADTRVNHLTAVTELGVGAYIGVPLEAAHARLYILCCLAKQARDQLRAGDVRFLRGLGTALADELAAPSAR